MISTVEDVLQGAADLLGDSNREHFTDNLLLPFFKKAYRELYGHLLLYQLPKAKLTALYTLSASTTSLTPATAGISNFGELFVMEERTAGSSDDYQDLDGPVDRLPQRDPETRLMEFTWANDTWGFVGSTENRQLRITYYSSGSPPISGTLGIDGAEGFLESRTAQLAGFPHGYIDASGAAKDTADIELDLFLRPMILALQQSPVQPQRYGRNPRTRGYRF